MTYYIVGNISAKYYQNRFDVGKSYCTQKQCCFLETQWARSQIKSAFCCSD